MAASSREVLRCCLVPGVALALLAVILVTDGNRDLFLLFNGLGAHTGDALWANWTLLGDGLVLLVLVLPFAGRRPELVWALMLTALAAGIVVPALKGAFGLPRPPAVLPPDLIHVIGHRLTSRSFPSGHTTAAFAFAGMVSLYLRRGWVTGLLLVVAAGVGVSRMAVGAHWPLDVTAGAALGWLCAVAGMAAARRWRWGLSPAGQRTFSVLLLGCAVALLFFFRADSPAAAWLPGVVAVVALAAAAPAQLRLWRAPSEGVG